MTKRLELVNLSNWDGEDFVITQNGKEVTLRPGEHVTISPYYYEDTTTIDVKYVEAEDSKPFMMDKYGQIVPTFRLDWSLCSSERRGQVSFPTEM